MTKLQKTIEHYIRAHIHRALWDPKVIGNIAVEEMKKAEITWSLLSDRDVKDYINKDLTIEDHILNDYEETYIFELKRICDSHGKKLPATFGELLFSL